MVLTGQSSMVKFRTTCRDTLCVKIRLSEGDIMKNTFREYNRYTEQELKTLWKSCLFVFDANTLLNMYEYSRETVSIYFKVLERLKANRRLWIPYQVGYEFYEKRIDVISKSKKSYTEIISVLKGATNTIETEYRDHPFLDLGKISEKMKEALSSIEAVIEEAKKKHPNWLKDDDVLKKINELFEGSVGENYDEERLREIRKEGAERYKRRIPPGFKDSRKDDNRFGDLILWYQIIDKASQCKKPIFFISGDVKEDWWLKTEDGKRLMPLPQLRREMYEKGNVDFHIYTPVNFLRLSKTDKDKIDDGTIQEVRRIGELEEKRVSMERMRLTERERELEHRDFGRRSMAYVHSLGKLDRLFMEINESGIDLQDQQRLDSMFHRLRHLTEQIIHGGLSRAYSVEFNQLAEQILFILKNASYQADVHPKLGMVLDDCTQRWEDFTREFQRYL